MEENATNINIFDAVKEAVPVPLAAERYGLIIHRSRMVRCPFHDDRTPRLKLNDRYFYCFGCQASGSVIDLTAKLFDLSPCEAARKLASDFNIDVHPVTRREVMQTQAQTPADAFRWRKVLNEYLDQLVRWYNRYQPTAPDSKVDERYVEACHMMEPVDYLLNQMTTGTPDERSSVLEQLRVSKSMSQLEARLVRLRTSEAELG